jgi:3',5'-cyclic AMP phosphodiesterase CpdA
MEMRDRRGVADGVDRRGMLRCMAWVGTGLVWTVSGGVLGCKQAGTGKDPDKDPAKGDFTFAQISDSHIGFSREPNKDVTATLKEAVERLNGLPQQPAFLLHTGDLTHLAKPEEFDTVAEVLKGVRAGKVYAVPGEHDFDGDNDKLYLERFGRGTRGTGWYSFDYKGVHFVGLANVANAKSGGPGGLGVLGGEQLAWLEKDVAGLGDSTAVVVFAHVPLWMVYEKWGWGTHDGERALTLLRRFGSLTVLNGHIHQIMHKVEGKVVFHTARSTAFPQGKPGEGAPGPVRNLPAGKLRAALGVTQVAYAENPGPLAVTDSTLE